MAVLVTSPILAHFQVSGTGHRSRLFLTTVVAGTIRQAPWVGLAFVRTGIAKCIVCVFVKRESRSPPLLPERETWWN